MPETLRLLSAIQIDKDCWPQGGNIHTGNGGAVVGRLYCFLYLESIVLLQKLEDHHGAAQVVIVEICYLRN